MDKLISLQAAIDVMDSETVSTSPEHFKSSDKFIKFMDDADIASFGKWQWANGFNTALVSTTVQLKKLSTAQPERKKGKWNHGSCSVCGYDWGKDAPLANVPPFCPNCGADMRGENE